MVMGSRLPAANPNPEIAKVPPPPPGLLPSFAAVEFCLTADREEIRTIGRERSSSKSV